MGITTSAGLLATATAGAVAARKSLIDMLGSAVVMCKTPLPATHVNKCYETLRGWKPLIASIHNRKSESGQKRRKVSNAARNKLYMR